MPCTPPPMKRILALACLMAITALTGCIPIGFRASTQSIVPPAWAAIASPAPAPADIVAR
jgi:hypothetical protein